MSLTPEQQTQKELAIANAKANYASKLRTLAAEMKTLFDNSENLRAFYLDNDYQVGGANEIVDSDVFEYRFSEADLHTFATLLEQVINFADSNRATINKIRQ